jgi:hypothetical protein
MLSRGKYILIADADGATKFSDYAKLEEELERMVLIIPSRHLT